MDDFERDYPDHRHAPYFEHGDEGQTNTSNNRTFYEVMDGHMRRRGFLAGGIAAMAAGLFGNALSVRGAFAATSAPSALLGFDAVPVSFDDTVVVPPGYKVQILGAWGEPIVGAMPAFDPANTGADQAMQIGQHHDGLHFFAIDGSSTDGLIVVNHEYIEPRLLHVAKWKGMELGADDVVYAEDGSREDDDVLKEMNAHGVSVYRAKRGADGAWAIAADPMNRRITALTEIELAGPVRGTDYLKTRFSPDGTRTRGTLNNCAYGVTPWNTYMAAEENWAGYFANTDAEMSAGQKRYGISDDPKGGRYGWHLAKGAADEVIRFDISAKGASAAEDYRNEANGFGWMVEIDPMDPASVPVKRTSLGRFAHEGVVFAPAVEGRPVVCYSGDDSRFEYIYKFVSDAPYAAGSKGDILDSGTLYVARFEEDGTGKWLALKPGENGLTPENGFADLAAILVDTRLAADKAGATKMDRPEWGTVDPTSGEVYFTLTNNTKREQSQVDAMNPRAENNFGHIIRWKYADGDHSATGFDWNLFVLAGTPQHSETADGAALGEDNIFACPDGLWCDPDSRLWIQTDMGDIGPEHKGPLKEFGMNGMLAADPATGEIRRFLTGPWGQECTGVITTPDQTSMFVNFQHPGAHATPEQFAAGDMGSTFPDGDKAQPPRSATIVITRENGGKIGA
ncbi:PhoX family phosphatase [Paracoccus suum]|uniref:PhoX family phosphatase n=1 Tax=Paracoccus suum TaxID=2259340 RepID=A0A344PJ25_9RHOB|nr:PhoX family phosphatase [Paracoccus suum]AXC49380.1 PhoX family phosphatase [Paracoccus suum]